MYIVGTSEHIDHGKTSLILALTGTDCDRLPEEKERAMTIDIGFASMEFPKLGTVSVIDVPGHERFIRNMVVGAWGIDLALLVVAVDDGWMPQTEDHFRVLQLLGIDNLIVVLNKIDAADEDMISFVEEEVLEKLFSTEFESSPVMRVSAKTGAGIEELRQGIAAALKKLPKASDAKKPYMFVDRVFASKGYGTVITGTLKNGVFADDDEVKILPLNGTARIKRIESHFSEQSEGSPSQRTALNLSGVNTDEIKRGHIILRGNFFSETSDIIARIRIIREKKIKNNAGIEILIGAASVKGKIILLADIPEDAHNFAVRIKLDDPWYVYPGQPFVLANPGGYRILGGGTVLLSDFAKASNQKIFKQKINIFEKFDLREIIMFHVSCFGHIERTAMLAKFPYPDKYIDKTIADLIDTGALKDISGWLVTPPNFNTSRNDLLNAVKSGVGLNLKEISDLAGLDMEIAKIILNGIAAEEPVIEKEGRYFTADSITEDALTEDKKKILQTILENGIEGVEIDKLSNDKMKKDVKDLIKLGFAVSLDGKIIYHKKTYDELKNKVMNLFESAPKISVPQAKDATDLSRKYIIPLLNRIETDGLIKRIGDFRMKV